MAIGLLSACSTLKKFPVDKVWEFDQVNRVCAEYVVVQYDPKLQFQPTGIETDIDHCPSIFGFTSADMPKVLNWEEDAVKFAKEKCH